MNVLCLFCGNPITVHSRMKLGEQLSCSHCKTVFRLISKSPFQIDWLDLNDEKDHIPNEGKANLDELA